jgi:hypothetical protein
MRFRRLPANVVILLAVTILSLGVLAWAIVWNFEIGITASDTNTSGGNNAAWLWLFGSLGSFVILGIALVIVGTRVARQRRSQ